MSRREKGNKMKRIQSACLEQTLHFQLKEDVDHSLAVSEVQAEYEKYKNRLNKMKVRYEIVEERVQDDGSILLKIKKQYNGYDVGEYLN